MPKLPVVSGTRLVKLLGKLGYEAIRQRGSHIVLRKVTEAGEHSITVPNHPEMQKEHLTTYYQNYQYGTIYPKII